MSKLFDERFLRRLEYLHLVSKKVYRGRQRAERRSKKVGSGLEFADHRDYSPGDDFRYIDWKVYARMERMLIRLHEEEEDLMIYLLVDCSRSMSVSGFGEATKFEHAARLAAALAYVGLANLDRVSIIPFGDTLKGRMAPVRGKNQIFKVFNFLENLEPGGVTNLQDCLKKFVHQNKRRGMAVVLSDFYDPDGYEDALNYLRYNNFEPLVVHLYDELEMSPSLRGDLTLVDCETGESREITITPRMLKRYKELHDQFSEKLERFCKQSHMSCFRTPIQLPYDEIVLRMFRAGGFLK